MKKSKIFLIVLTILLTTGGSMFFYKKWRGHKLNQYVIDKVNEIYNSLSLEDRVGQLFMISLPGKTYSKAVEKELEAIMPGFIIYFRLNLDKSISSFDPQNVDEGRNKLLLLNQKVQEFLVNKKNIPALITTDQEGGRVIRIVNAVNHLPSAMIIGQTNDGRLGHKLGFVSGYQLKELGIHLVLAPIVDINNNPKNPVINTRSFGSSIDMVRRTAIPYMAGINQAGNISIVKHFPGHGDTYKDSHITLPVVNKSEQELMAFELQTFQAAINQGVEMVMTAHISYPKLDSKNIATLSPVILNDLLRKKMKFNGIIMSDALEMKAIAKTTKPKEKGLLALKAGIDILLYSSWGKEIAASKKYILQEIKAGRYSEKDIEEKVKKIIRIKLHRGLLHKYNSSYVKKDDNWGKVITQREAKITEFYQSIDLEALENEVIERGMVGMYKEVPLNLAIHETIAYYSTNSGRRAFNKQGFTQARLKPIASLSQHKKIGDKIALVELDSAVSIQKFNAVLKPMKINDINGLKEYRHPSRIIGLLFGSPFRRVFIPEKGGVILAFQSDSKFKEKVIKSIFLKNTAIKAELSLPEN